MMTEAIALREGLELATILSLSRVQAKSDSSDVINACNGDERWWNKASEVFADCMDSVATIGEVSFNHCPRKANKVAHELARFCFDNSLSCNWVDEPPRFFARLFDKRCNSTLIGATNFRRNLFLTRAPKGTGRFL
jgi:hypothetical protein